MSVCVFARKKRQKNSLGTDKNTTIFGNAPTFSKLVYPVLPTGTMFLTKKCQKQHKKKCMLKLVYECIALFPRDLLRKKTHTLIH